MLQTSTNFDFSEKAQEEVVKIGVETVLDIMKKNKSGV